MSLIFFFQAKDGIRDLYVTGVQTCALPISSRRNRVRDIFRLTTWIKLTKNMTAIDHRRSEERRVGKKSRLQRCGCLTVTRLTLMSLIKMMLVMVSVAAISKMFGLLRFLLRLSFLAKIGRASCRERV